MEGNKNLKTDQDTDMMFSFLVNSDKLNPEEAAQLKDNRNRKIEDNIKDIEQQLQEHSKLTKNNLQDDNISKLYKNYTEHVSSKQSIKNRQTIPTSINHPQIRVNRSPYKKTETQTPVKSYNPPPTYQQYLPPQQQSLAPQQNEEDTRAKARDYYSKLMGLKKRYKNIDLKKHYTMDSDPQELKEEYEYQYNLKDREVKTRFYKRVVLGGVSIIEMLNTSYDPFNIDLDKWSESVATEIDDYDDIFNELYEKYKEIGKNLPPEIRLIGALGFSGITYHISKKMFDNGDLDNIVLTDANKKIIQEQLATAKSKQVNETKPEQNLNKIHEIINKKKMSPNSPIINRSSYEDELNTKIQEIPNDVNYEMNEEDLDAILSDMDENPDSGIKQPFVNDEILNNIDDANFSLSTSEFEGTKSSSLSSVKKNSIKKSASQKKKEPAIRL